MIKVITRHRFWPLLTLLTVGGAVSALALVVRFYVVEPQNIAVGCAASNTGFLCLVREIAVAGFLTNSYETTAFGMTALIAGVAATVVRWRLLALIAIVAGIMGAVLYAFELSGVGLLLGAFVWVYRAPSVAQVSAD